MFHYIYVLPWSKILLMMPVMTILSAILVIIAKRILKKPKWIYITLFALWAMAVVYTTIIVRPTDEYFVSLKPFASYEWALIQPEYYRSNFMNVLLFFPGGVMLGLALHDKKRFFARVSMTILLLAGMSICIEALQYFLAKGTAETDDVIHNTLGAIFGVGAAMTVEWLNLLFSRKHKEP